MTLRSADSPQDGLPARETMHGLLESLAPGEGISAQIAEGFLHRSDDSYLVSRTPDSLLQQWRDLASWVTPRDSNSIMVRVFNPSIKAHGFRVNGTVVQTCMQDQPFIFDTIRNMLAALELPPQHCVHPILGIDRNKKGSIRSVVPLPAEGDNLESIMHLEIPRLSKKKDRQELEASIIGRLQEVQAVVTDHDAMRKRTLWLASHLSESTGPASPDFYRHVAVAQKFFHWLVDDNFVFLGYQEFELQADSKDDLVVGGIEGSLLGLPRLHDGSRSHQRDSFPESARQWLAGTELIFLGKGQHDTGIHRPGMTDHIAVRMPGQDGNRVALFTGLYTHKAIREDINRIPILREKLDDVLQAESAVPGSHLARKVEEAFRTVPVEYLFGANATSIQRVLSLVISAEEEEETGVHVLADSTNRAAFVVISLPRVRYDDEVRKQLSKRLLEVMGGNYSDWRLALGQEGQVVLQFYVTSPSALTHKSEEEVAEAIEEVTGSWQERLTRIVRSRTETPGKADELIGRYGDAFPEEHTHTTDPSEAAEDIQHLERARKTGDIVVAVASRADDLVAGVTRLKIYQPQKIYLTDSTPVLDHFGLRVIDQSSVTVSAAQEEAAWIDSFRVVPTHRRFDLEEHADRLVEAMERTLSGRAEDDRLNALVVSANLTSREVGVIRAYIAYGRQLGSSVPFESISRTWCDHPEAAKLLLRLFRSRFRVELGAADDPDRRQLVARNEKAFLKYLDSVTVAAEDRILRRAFNLVQATLRTNFWAGAEQEGHPLSMKLDCSAIDSMPDPRPYREIWVQHNRFEGVHLRGGPVARGGLRWSDRPADFRTEILGLMDTQMIKNVLIVPVGAKGGFVLKGTYPNPTERRAAADKLYRLFIRGLLDLTDNIVEGDVVPPQSVVRYDGDDAYLVVAADKGTAHLSDTANAVAEDYGFWLGDAFASGGSHGYDHKKYGITAKGGWVCVRRHFREMSLDPEVDPITAIGIGDMGGDVFGNGFLLSQSLKLIAAFNHMHIFLDPDPNPEVSWAERKRLFEVPRSSWDDYDRKLLSPGGGIFSRQSKAIALSPEVQAMLGSDEASMEVQDLISAILRIEADLLWNGGIGTYVKASHESHRDAEDPANDDVRIDASELRVKVVGEGGNLGFTQAARVQFAQAGGAINADSMDNSGGVDMSDHEVNLKILFRGLERSGQLNRKQRDEMLVRMAHEVSDAVQGNNHHHSLMVSLDIARSADNLDDFRVLLNDLDSSGRVDRSRHALPEEGELLRRIHRKQGLLRPELCRLGPFVKMEVYEALLSDPGFDQAYVNRWLHQYFPQIVREEFTNEIDQHQLRNEISATVITNTLVDAMGVTHFSRMGRLTGASVLEIAFASLLAADLLQAWDVKEGLRDLPDVRASVEYVKLRHVEESVTELAQWLLHRRIDLHEPQKALERFEPSFRRYEKVLLRILDRSERREHQRRLRYMRNRSIRGPTADRAAGLEWVAEAGDAVLLTERNPWLDVVSAGMLLKQVARDTRLLRARQLASPSDARDGWESRAIADLRSSISLLVVTIATRALEGMKPPAPSGRKKGAGRKGTNTRRLPTAIAEQWKSFAEERRAVLNRAAQLQKRIEASRARGLPPALVLYGAVRSLRE